MTDRERDIRTALRRLIKSATKFQLETDEKKRNGRIWDDLYESIDHARDVVEGEKK